MSIFIKDVVYLTQKEDKLKQLNQELLNLITGEKDWLANMANASALIYNKLDNLNWVGFYLLKDGELVLGPFQGLPACIRIKIGKGVCGTAVVKRKTILVEDVHQFPGHIACDQASRSELVIPLIVEGEVKGVLDLDSPVKSRFDVFDQKYLEEFCHILIGNSNFTF